LGDNASIPAGEHFSHSLARAKSDEGGHLATLADIEAQRWNKAMGQFW
jgi:hypothetical protein